MSKKLLVPVAVILACAVILAAAGAGLAGTAAANAEKELGEMISYLLPGGGEFEEIEYKGTDSKITNVYKGEGGYVLAMTANGYVDEIKLLVAVDNEGVVKGYTVRDIHDTYGLGLGVQDDLFFLVGLMNSKGGLAVNSNRAAVQQMASILLDNAVKHSPPGAKISLKAFRKGRRIVIEVSNTCEELARPELKHLFDRFYRVDQSHSETASGSGIGLSVAKATAEALGGKIHAELSGNVICFQITL